MKKMVIISLIIICFGSVVMGQSFDLASLNKALELINQSIKLNEEDKSIKAKKLKIEAERILAYLFKKNNIIVSEFVKADQSLGWNNAFHFPETGSNPLFKFYNDVGTKGIRTSDEITEKFQDCNRFRAKIQIIKYWDSNDFQTYTINGHLVHVDCKILSIEPIAESESSFNKQSE